MTDSRLLVLVTVALGALLSDASRASAHDLIATVRVNPDIVTVEAGYDDETPAEEARVTVTDTEGTRIASGVLDNRGLWSFPRPAPGEYVAVVEAAGHRDRVKFTVAATDPSAAPTPEPATYSNWRLDKRLGLAIGLAVILGATLVYSYFRRRREGPKANEATC